MKDLRIVFMGTPEFALIILDGIIKYGANVVGVITAPDKRAGRGRKLSQSSVKAYAVQNQLNLLQPTNLKDETFLLELDKLMADVFVVVAFRMLPEVVYLKPPLGTINLHASVLPQYRGAAPINWAIINGEEETGVTTFFIEKEIDTGKIILFDNVKITENETAGELHDKLSQIGITTVINTLEKVANKDFNLIDQNQLNFTDLKKAPKIFKENCQIDLNLSAKKVHDFIRGLSPYPGAYCKLERNGTVYNCKLFETRLTSLPTSENKLIKVENGILFPCSDNYLLIKEIQIEGKRRMTTKQFLAGHDLEEYKICI